MMHFPSWESFEQTVEMLEQQVDNHEDSFVMPNDALSEDDLNDLEESSGFDADLPLKEYEQWNEFCSLRAKLEIEESTWLNNLPVNPTNLEWVSNPLDNSLVDGTEQTLVNEQSEVMICGLIYKPMEDGMLIIDANNPRATDALSFANNNTSSGKEVIDELNTKEDSVVFFTPNSDGDCLYHSAKTMYESTATNRKIRMRHRLDSRYEPNAFQPFINPNGQANMIIVSTTNNYQRKGNKWKRFRIRTMAGVEGKRINSSLGCPEYVETDDRTSIKKRKRQCYRERSFYTLIDPQRGVLEGDFLSKHVQGNDEYFSTFD